MLKFGIGLEFDKVKKDDKTYRRMAPFVFCEGTKSQEKAYNMAIGVATLVTCAYIMFKILEA